MITLYGAITYEVILQRMLDAALSRNSNLDTREGSIIYNALAPAAVELQNMYIQLDTILNETFADTADREYLIKRAAERGIVPYPATPSIIKAAIAPDAPVGSRFSLDAVNYIVTEKMGSSRFKLECETLGSIGNSIASKRLIPIDYIDGLEGARVIELLMPGEDEEDTESLRRRYYANLNADAFGGNISDYLAKVNAIPGVGGVKVHPAWNGGGTVKIVIIGSDYKAPSTELVDAVQNAIDPSCAKGLGHGIAPIGHVVTVMGASKNVINIAASITYQDGMAWGDIQERAEKAIDDYFRDLTKAWNQNESLVVRISQIETRLLSVPGILDISDTTLNGQASNMELETDSIPVRGGFSG